jgi:CPA2 family monovalent cation:H+ antiporter-2
MTAVIAIAILITALSYNILPPIEFALAVLVVAGLLVMLMWRWFVRMHYRMQITLIETMNQNKDEH